MASKDDTPSFLTRCGNNGFENSINGQPCFGYQEKYITLNFHFIWRLKTSIIESAFYSTMVLYVIIDRVIFLLTS